MQAPALSESDATPPDRPSVPLNVAIIANSQTPYRLHLHRRIVRELPAIRLWSLYTHEESNAPWRFDAPAEINPVSFGEGEASARQSDWRRIVHEFRKGGRIIRWLKAYDVRAVVVMGYNDAARLRIIRWCHRHGVSCWVFGDSNIRTDRPTGVKRWVKRWWVGWVMRHVDGALACGTLGEAYFRKYGARRVHLMPYEPDYDQIRRVGSSAADLERASLGIPPNKRLLIYSGRLAPEKRVDLLIGAFSAIAEERENWDLLVIGAGPLRESLQSKVPPSLDDRVHWTGFIADPTRVSALYRTGDVLVLPSDYEPWAVVINEAAAAGLAIVASDVVGAAAEIVRDGENGFIFPAGDRDALIDRLMRVTDPQKIDSLKQASERLLADWRKRGDPVTGLGNALSHFDI